MIPIPAIDISEGKAVRLVRGVRAQKKIYGDPLDFARQFAREGAERIHLVNLDGAFSEKGEGTALAILERIVGETKVPVEVGGGLRDAEGVARVFAAGAAYAILGTVAVHDLPAARKIAEAHAGKIYFGLDIRAGRAQIRGWTEAGGAWREVLSAWKGFPIRGIIVTAVERDGALAGPDLTLLSEVAAAAKGLGFTTIASGGVARLEDLDALAGAAPFEGTILGKSIYENAFTLAEARARLGG